jgi:hypothetical protein
MFCETGYLKENEFRKVISAYNENKQRIFDSFEAIYIAPISHKKQSKYIENYFADLKEEQNNKY